MSLVPPIWNTNPASRGRGAFSWQDSDIFPRNAKRLADTEIGEALQRQWAHEDSNLGPHPYQGCALAN